MTGPWDDRTPKTKYRMLWGGAWRPVLQMFDAGNTPTTRPERSAKAVLWAEDPTGAKNMVVVVTGPADIFTSPDYVGKNWERVD